MSALRGAVAIADDLIGAPGRWRARAALGRVAYALGDDDAAAETYAEARNLLETFAARLAPERSARLLSAPVADEILSAGSR